MIEHISAILMLILLEGVLSADNALVLAVLVKHLPRHQHRKALLYGLGGAFVFRGVAILLAQHILEIWWLQALGAVYLAYLSVAHFVKNNSIHHQADRVVTHAGFWRTVVGVELTDIAFATDSIMVAVALTSELWVIYIGAGIGIVAIRMLASYIVRLLFRFPQIETVAYLLVGWISVKLFFSTWGLFSSAILRKPIEHHLLPPWVFWMVMILIVVVGGWYSIRHPIPNIVGDKQPTPFEEISQPENFKEDSEIQSSKERSRP